MVGRDLYNGAKVDFYIDNLQLSRCHVYDPLSWDQQIILQLKVSVSACIFACFSVTQVYNNNIGSYRSAQCLARL